MLLAHLIRQMTRSVVRTILLVVFLNLLGCSSLIIREDDDAGIVTGKVISRVGLGLVTLGISEIAIAESKHEEEQSREAQALVDNWNKAIGRYTYDDALRQFGPPTSIAEGNSVFVAVWQDAPGPVVMIPGPSFGFGPTYFGTQIPGARRELTFDKRTHRLTRWRFW